jgi:hypothetical protein
MHLILWFCEYYSNFNRSMPLPELKIKGVCCKWILTVTMRWRTTIEMLFLNISFLNYSSPPLLQWHSGIIRGATSPEGDNLVVFYYLSISEIWPLVENQINVYLHPRYNLHNSFNLITVFPVFRFLTDFVCLYTYEFWLSIWKIVRSSVILLLPLYDTNCKFHFLLF